jgi:hypothetical protein
LCSPTIETQGDTFAVSFGAGIGIVRYGVIGSEVFIRDYMAWRIPYRGGRGDVNHAVNIVLNSSTHDVMHTNDINLPHQWLKLIRRNDHAGNVKDTIDANHSSPDAFKIPYIPEPDLELSMEGSQATQGFAMLLEDHHILSIAEQALD